MQIVPLAFNQKETNKKSVRSGFSLMELLIYATIVLILISGMGYIILQLMDSAKETKTKAIMSEIKFAIEHFYSDTSQYPTSLTDLIVRPQGDGFDGWAGPYLPKRKTVPKSGWDKPFSYQLTPDAENPYELKTKKPSGVVLSAWTE